MCVNIVVKVISFEFGSVVLAAILCYFIYKKSQEINFLKETVQIQHQAIMQQRMVIELQQHQLRRQQPNIFNQYQ